MGVTDCLRISACRGVEAWLGTGPLVQPVCSVPTMARVPTTRRNREFGFTRTGLSTIVLFDRNRSCTGLLVCSPFSLLLRVKSA